MRAELQPSDRPCRFRRRRRSVVPCRANGFYQCPARSPRLPQPGGHVHDALDNQRRILHAVGCGRLFVVVPNLLDQFVIGRRSRPRDLERAEIRTVDLVERRILPAPVGAAVIGQSPTAWAWRLEAGGRPSRSQPRTTLRARTVCRTSVLYRPRRGTRCGRTASGHQDELRDMRRADTREMAPISRGNGLDVQTFRDRHHRRIDESQRRILRHQ